MDKDKKEFVVKEPYVDCVEIDLKVLQDLIKLQ